MSNRLTIKESVKYLKTIYNLDFNVYTIKYWCYKQKIPAEKQSGIFLIQTGVLDKIGKNFKGHEKGGRPKWALADKRCNLIPALR